MNDEYFKQNGEKFLYSFSIQSINSFELIELSMRYLPLLFLVVKPSRYSSFMCLFF